MSVSSRSTYIDNLDYDTLLHIFMMNANMFLDEDALVITCATSLVCRRWRSLMLNTPSLWARLIDMDWISCAVHYEFRRKLMKRTGTAPLWIRMKWIRAIRPANHPKTIETFLFNIVHKNWYRIQKLVILFQIRPSFPLSSWPAFFRSAPALETFDVTLPVSRGWLQPENPEGTPISALFSGCAPLLQKFSLTSFKIDHHHPWLCQLLSLEFHSTYDVHLVLAILSSTSQLQQLKISYLVHKDSSSSLPTATLPHLKRLEYRGGFEEGAILLNHVEIPLDCCFCMNDPLSGTLNWGRVSITDEEFFSIFTAYLRHAQRYFRSHKAPLVSLNFDPKYFLYIEVKAKCSTDVPLNLPLPLRKDRTSNVPALILEKLEELALPEFSYAIELEFISEVPLPNSFWSILSCFTSVKTIYSDCQTLGYLSELEDSNAAIEKSSLFPMLDVINLSVHYLMRDDTFKVDTVAAEFILSRMRNGRPITALHLKRENTEWCPIPDLEALAEAKGLKVLYTYLITSYRPRFSETYVDVEYICGSVDRDNTSDTV